MNARRHYGKPWAKATDADYFAWVEAKGRRNGEGADPPDDEDDTTEPDPDYDPDEREDD